jgi:pimeloyl-ACP methyl ester carboxylesterase
MHYEQLGSGEPLILLPFLTADHACYSFQLPEYAKQFTCFTIDHRGAGLSDKPPGPYSTEMLADDVAAFMQQLDIPRAHISGLSLGAATGMWLAAKHPEKVKSLSLHSPWHKTDAYCRTVVEGWQTTLQSLGSVPELVVRAIFPWCLTPELYASRPEYVQSLADFVRSRPAQPVESFLAHSNAVLAHDVKAHLGRIQAPTQITFGRHDAVTSTRFAAPIRNAIRNSELIVFENCSHAPLFERVDEFNTRTLEFLRRQVSQTSAAGSFL